MVSVKSFFPVLPRRGTASFAAVCSMDRAEGGTILTLYDDNHAAREAEAIAAADGGTVLYFVIGRSGADILRREYIRRGYDPDRLPDIRAAYAAEERRVKKQVAKLEADIGGAYITGGSTAGAISADAERQKLRAMMTPDKYRQALSPEDRDALAAYDALMDTLIVLQDYGPAGAHEIAVCLEEYFTNNRAGQRHAGSMAPVVVIDSPDSLPAAEQERLTRELEQLIRDHAARVIILRDPESVAEYHAPTDELAIPDPATDPPVTDIPEDETVADIPKRRRGFFGRR